MPMRGCQKEEFVPLYVVIMEGKTPDSSEPLVATRDRRIVKIVADQLAARLSGAKDPSLPYALTQDEVADEEDEPDEDEAQG